MKLSRARMAQVIVATLVFCLSLAIMGTAGHSLSVYRGQSSSNPWWLPLWPQHFNVQGTNSLIGSAAFSTVTTLVFVVLCFVPKLKLATRPTHFAFISILLTLPSATVTLAIVIYVHVLNHQSPSSETIQTWTCKLKNQKPLSTNATVPGGVSNHEFSRLCAESKFAHYTSLAVFLLQVIMLVGVVFGWVVDKWHAHQHKKHQWQETSSVVEMNMHLGAAATDEQRSDTDAGSTVLAAATAKDEERGVPTTVSVQPLRAMAPSRY